MKLMQEYALARVCEGTTTIDEVLRVVPFEDLQAHCCQGCQRELAPSFRFCPYCGEKTGSENAQAGLQRSLVEQGATE